MKDIFWHQDTLAGGRGVGGLRECPNDECRAIVFVVLANGKLLEAFPPEVIDFDATNLPGPLIETLEEAVRCHAARCYRASALLVRRLLEELCDDKGVTKGDLKSRLAALAKTIVVPNELLDAADQLRLLGNDAAHVQSKTYDSIGTAEATLAIELAKELLKATYQYASLLSKLKAMQKS